MGKVKPSRQKPHIPAKRKRTAPQVLDGTDSGSAKLVLPLPSNDLFSGLNIDVSTLKTKLTDDIQSVKSCKSEKTGQTVIVPKKEKLKLRRDMLLRKIDSVNQMKKEQKIREKRKTTAIMGDTNPLHDALPSLEYLLKNRPNVKQSVMESRKKKAIEKARKRQKGVIQGMKIYKTILNDKTFQNNPLEAISQHLQSFVNQEKQKLKKS